MEHWPGIRFVLITLIVLVLVLAGKQSKSLSVVVEILRGRPQISLVPAAQLTRGLNIDR